jgi:hypothetical protein
MNIDSVPVQCPYCFESLSLDVESDVEGEYVQDCEVCCNPWQVHVRRRDGKVRVRIDRAQ